MMNTVDFSVANDWGSGFTANLSIANNGTSPLNGWTVEFDAPFKIENVWNGEIVSQKGNHYIIRNLSWNPTVPANGTVTFGFNGSNPNSVTTKPIGYILNGVSLGAAPAPAPASTPTPSPVIPTLAIDDITVTEGNSSTKDATFTVKLSQASTQSVTVKYATANGSATAGSDYAAASDTLTFAPGETQKQVSIKVNGDAIVEPNETFLVKLTSPSNATLSRDQGIGTIANDDIAPVPAPTPAPVPISTPVPIPAPVPIPTPTPAASGAFNYGEALQKSILFYEAQRSGKLPANNRVSWRGNSALNDGKDVGVDLTGGYYDAGDHVKFGLPMAASMTMLSWGASQYRGAYQKSGQLPDILNTIKWGTDYILKAHTAPNEFWGQVGLGGADHAFWGPPEKMTMARPAFKIDAQHPGSDLAGEAAAALASASIVFRSTDAGYADRLLKNAVELYSFADTYRGKYSDSIPDAANYYNSYSYTDELAWGAAWLHKAIEATGKTDTTYLNKAQANYQGLYTGWTQSWDEKSYGTAILLAQETGQSKYRSDVEDWLNNWSDKNSSTVAHTSGGLAWLSQWGSLRYSANTAFLAGVYGDTVNDPNKRYSNFAEDQIDYILGDNPNQRSYVVGFGKNSPRNPHHRSSHGSQTNNINDPLINRNVLYGALVGGPSAANDNAYSDDRTNFITNEVALDYNAAFTGAVARLYDKFGGNPIAGFPNATLSGLTTAVQTAQLQVR